MFVFGVFAYSRVLSDSGRFVTGFSLCEVSSFRIGVGPEFCRKRAQPGVCHILAEEHHSHFTYMYVCVYIYIYVYLCLSHLFSTPKALTFKPEYYALGFPLSDLACNSQTLVYFCCLYLLTCDPYHPRPLNPRPCTNT